MALLGLHEQLDAHCRKQINTTMKGHQHDRRPTITSAAAAGSIHDVTPGPAHLCQGLAPRPALPKVPQAQSTI